MFKCFYLLDFFVTYLLTFALFLLYSLHQVTNCWRDVSSFRAWWSTLTSVDVNCLKQCITCDMWKTSVEEPSNISNVCCIWRDWPCNQVTTCVTPWTSFILLPSIFLCRFSEFESYWDQNWSVVTLDCCFVSVLYIIHNFKYHLNKPTFSCCISNMIKEPICDS